MDRAFTYLGAKNPLRSDSSTLGLVERAGGIGGAWVRHMKEANKNGSHLNSPEEVCS